MSEVIKTNLGWEWKRCNATTSYSHLFDVDGAHGVIDDILRENEDLRLRLEDSKKTEHIRWKDHRRVTEEIEALKKREARLKKALEEIAYGKQHSGVIPCPQDWQFYVMPWQETAKAALQDTP